MIVGAGAIGGVVGGRLFQAGYDVVLVARGEHGRAIQENGLTLSDPVETVNLAISCVSDVGEVTFGNGDVVLLAVKSQDTAAAVDSLIAVASPDVPVVCMQNGVANERTVLRWFARVYGCAVLCPTVYLEPGHVRAHSTPLTGILDVGRYPSGSDEVAEAVTSAFANAAFASEPNDNVMALKYQKLVANLANAIEVLCGPQRDKKPVIDLVRAEGKAVLDAAGIDQAPIEVMRRAPLSVEPVGDTEREGGSTYQSVLRSAGSVETDYLNGEIVLLGREHAIETPANETICALVREVIAGQRGVASMSSDDLLAAIQAHSA